MAFVFKIQVCERVGSFTVEDVSGNWQADFPFGYGVQTILPAWVTECKAYITTPLSEQVIVKDLGSQFPGNGSEFQFMPWDFGWNKKIESGLWIVKVVIKGTTPQGKTFQYSAETKDVFTKEVECCVDKMTGKTYNIKLNDVFQDDQSKKVAELSVLLERALRAKKCCDIISANNIITDIRLNCRCGCNH